MGKRQRSTAYLEHCGCAAGAEGLQGDSEAKKSARSRTSAASKKDKASAVGAADERVMDGAEEDRVPLREVVADCVDRWFEDALKEAASGDVAMQVLVGQMYRIGYGVAKSDETANAWFTKASRYRSSVWQVSNKHPGYNASDSDSDQEG